MTSTKPYDIAKRTIWEAYQRVKANRGAAGIDGETIAMFEQDLSKNLFKLWNRSNSPTSTVIAPWFAARQHLT